MKQSAYTKIYDELLEEIMSGKYKPLSKLETELDLAKRFSVSVGTIRNAVNCLVEDGFVVRRQGSGTYVVENIPLTGFKNLKSTPGPSGLYHRIGLCVHNDEFHMGIVRGVENIMYFAGFQVIVSFLAMEIVNDVKKLNDLMEVKVDGIITLSPELYTYNSTTEYEDVLKKIRNLVIVGSNIEDDDLKTVATDDVEGALQAVRYLISLGYRRVVHLRGPEKVSNANERERGYLKALSECPDADAPMIFKTKGYNQAGGYAQMNEVLKKYDHKPLAVFCANDYIAAGAYQSILEHGLKIPEDISVIGYGNTQTGITVKPQLTTVCQNPEDMGRLAAEKLLKMIYRHVAEIPHSKIIPWLLIRNSCGIAKQNI
ncbi:MAG: GntR family transcriptional regulator [Lentisphaerota bacterium]